MIGRMAWVIAAHQAEGAADGGELRACDSDWFSSSVDIHGRGCLMPTDDVGTDPPSR